MPPTLASTSWIRGASKLSASSVANGALGLGFLALLTQIYDPVAYAQFAMFNSVVMTLATVVSGRYEVGIVVVRHDREGDAEAWGLARLALAVALFTLCVAQLAAMILWRSRVDTGLGDLILLLPLVTLLTVASSVRSLIDNRFARYNWMALLSVGTTVMQGAVQVALGLVSPNSWSLVAGLAAAVGLGTARLRFLLRRLRPDAPSPLRRLAAEHALYPKYQIWAALLNSVSSTAYVWVLAFTYGPVEVGLYSIGARLCMFPVTLVSTGISSAFMRQASIERGSPRDARRTYVRALGGVSAIALLSFLSLGAFAPFAGGVLGHGWEGSSSYIVVLIPLAAGHMVAAITNSAMTVYGRLGRLLGWRAALAALGPGCVLLAYQFGFRAPSALLVASLAMAAAHAVFVVDGVRMVSRPT